VGTFFTRDARREDFLPQYASVFGTAEGNATFYGLPPADTVAKWCAEAPAQFRFCFKFPKAISHERRLIGAGAETRQFFERVAPLGERLGPFFLQVHQSFGRRELPALEAYLQALPGEHQYAVEVRHPDFFDEGEGERTINELLGALGMERVCFDTHGLFASPAKDEATLAARQRKPRLPVRFTALGRQPFLRFVGDPAVERNESLLAPWADHVTRWIGEGRTPWFFAHHPDDRHAPAIGRIFQRLLHERCPQVPPPPAWPVEKETANRGEQLGLF
jgi:uncharacterized protein YecE (DUF72 family)